MTGTDIPDLPRYPGSVRAEYERGEEGDLILTRSRYLTLDERDAVREFYRGVFQSEGWTEADADFSRGIWTFSVTDDEREATVTIQPRGSAAVEVDVELSEPWTDEKAGGETIPETTQAAPPARLSPNPEKKAGGETTPETTQAAPPNPASTTETPAMAPGGGSRGGKDDGGGGSGGGQQR